MASEGKIIMFQVGWFSTGRDRAARELLQVVWESISKGEISARLAFVFSNREPGESHESDLFFERVRAYSLPLVCFSSQRFKSTPTGASPEWRIHYDREVMKRLRGFRPDLCVLAGYMLIVSSEMCRQYTMVNLHPAAPGGPAGTWQEVIWKLIESRADRTGAMMHLVTPELDKGPPATYCTFSIRGEPFDRHWQEIGTSSAAELEARYGERLPLFQLIRRFGLAREFPLIIATIKAFSEGKVSIRNGEVVNSKGTPISGYDLTEGIDRAVAGIL